jgi:quercetin dioxygenase-like cupin family protein
MPTLVRFASRVMLAALVPAAALHAQAKGVELEHESKHHEVFKNDFVEVFNVIVPAGDSTLYHNHRDDYVFVTFGGANLKSQKLGAEKADLIIADGEVRYTKAPITHRVLNPSKETFHNLSIDLLKANGKALGMPAGGDVVLDNAKVRVSRIVLEPGKSSVPHQHVGPELDIAVHPAKFDVVDDKGAAEHLSMKTADYKYHGTARTHTIKNTGTSRLELIEIDWK